MNEIDFSKWSLDVDGAELDDEGYYRCAECWAVLDATGDRDRNREYSASWWQCPECLQQFSISGVDATPDVEVA